MSEIANENKIELTNEQKESFKEVIESFPEIEKIEDLPQAVIEKAVQSGKPLLDELLRYRLSEEKAVKENAAACEKAKTSSVGSQINKSRGENPEAAEFLKGLWRK